MAGPIHFLVEQAGCDSCGARVEAALADLLAIEEITVDEDADVAAVRAHCSLELELATVNAGLAEASHGSGHAYPCSCSLPFELAPSLGAQASAALVCHVCECERLGRGARKCAGCTFRRVVCSVCGQENPEIAWFCLVCAALAAQAPTAGEVRKTITGVFRAPADRCSVAPPAARQLAAREVGDARLTTPSPHVCESRIAPVRPGAIRGATETSLSDSRARSS